MDLCYMPVLLFRTVNPVKCQDVLCKVIFFPLIPSAFIFVFIIENKICSSSPTPQKKKNEKFSCEIIYEAFFFFFLGYAYEAFSVLYSFWKIS